MHNTPPVTVSKKVEDLEVGDGLYFEPEHGIEMVQKISPPDGTRSTYELELRMMVDDRPLKRGPYRAGDTVNVVPGGTVTRQNAP